jgi:2-O-methyltransferase
MDIYEHIIRIAETSELKPRDWVIFELGAHLGSDTFNLRKIFPHGKLIAFEPDSRNFRALCQKDFTVGHVLHTPKLVNAAIGAKDGKAVLYQSSGHPPDHDPASNHTASSSICKPKKDTGFDWLSFENKEIVPVYTLDAYCSRNRIDHIDFIWSDIQGAELDMIKGGQNMLAKTRYLYTEYGQTTYESSVGLDDILKGLPGEWEVVEQYQWDVLLKNKNYEKAIPS